MRTKKKLLSIVLALAMVLSMMPVALAEGDDTDNAANSTTVTTLPQADANGVIKLT